MEDLRHVATIEHVATIACNVASCARDVLVCSLDIIMAEGPLAAETAPVVVAGYRSLSVRFRRELVISISDLQLASAAVTLREGDGLIPAHDVQLREQVHNIATDLLFAEPLTEELVTSFERAADALMRHAMTARRASYCAECVVGGVCPAST